MAAGRVEILVVGFEEPVIQPIGRAVGRRIGPEEDSVLVLEEESTRRVGLPAQLRNPRVDINEHVWVEVEPAADGGKVFAVIREVGANERRLRVASDDSVPLRMQLVAFRELRIGEEPVRVLVQLVPALIVAIQWSEERAGVGGVNLDGPFVFRADLPDCVELGVVHGDVAAVSIAMTEAERLVELQALGPRAKAGFESLGLAIGPAWVINALEIDEGVGEEPAGVGLVEGGEGLLETIIPAAVQVDGGPYSGGVHLGEITFDSGRG